MLQPFSSIQIISFFCPFFLLFVTKYLAGSSALEERLPTSCKELSHFNPSRTDGEYWLNVTQMNANMEEEYGTVRIYCHAMAHEYLTLGEDNTASWYIPGTAPNDDLKGLTSYKKVALEVRSYFHQANCSLYVPYIIFINLRINSASILN